MSYCCNYDVKNGSKVRNAACFREIYRCLSSVKEVTVYVLKDYNFSSPCGNHSASNTLLYSEEEIEEYINLLNKCGFNLNLKVGKCDEKDAYLISFKIGKEKGENSIFASLILLNAIRYLYEHTYNHVPGAFLHLCKYENDDVNIFTRFLIANWIIPSTAGFGHCTRNRCLLEKPLTDNEVKKHVIEYYENVTCVQGVLPKCKSFIPVTDSDQLKKMLENKLTLNEIYTKYLELCEKYS